MSHVKQQLRHEYLNISPIIQKYNNTASFFFPHLLLSGLSLFGLLKASSLIITLTREDVPYFNNCKIVHWGLLMVTDRLKGFAL